MIKLQVIFAYVWAWLSMVVPACVSPDNWEACANPKWITDAIGDLVHLSQIEPYAEEKEKVEEARGKI